MISTRLAAYLEARGVHYGWVVVAITFLIMLATAGAMGASGVILEPLQREFGWANADISFALAVRLLLFGLMGPFAAAFINRFGVRAVVAFAVALISIGIAGTMAMREVWQLLLFWGVVVGLGTGMTALVLGATVATRWFAARRGLVVGMLTASNATGQLVFLPLLASVAQHWGWRAALALVVSLLLTALVFVLALMRDRPSDLGLAPFGERAIVKPSAGVANITAMLLSPLVALREAAGSRVFWILFATFFVCGLSTNGLIQTHWITLCGDYGVTPVSAAGILAVIGVFDFVGTLFSGWLSDRYDNRWLLFFYYGLRGLSLIYLPYTEFSVVSLSLFAVFYGLDWVATVPPTVRLSADAFGPERANITFGWIFAAHQIGAACAAFGAGASRTGLSSYLPALYVAGAACLVAAALVLTLAQPRKRRPALA
ncbi:MAG: MFS transporter [Roseiarcus sp.]|jgi:predicted MFS family arabinose efflux permease